MKLKSARRPELKVAGREFSALTVRHARDGVGIGSREHLNVTDRRRAGGMIPPLGLMCVKIQEDGLPRARQIEFRPFFQRSQSSALCAAVNPIR